MKVTVVGVREYDFRDKETGRQVCGVKLHFTYGESGVDGVAVGSESLPDRPGFECAHSVKPGMQVNLDYFKNKLKGVEICK